MKRLLLLLTLISVFTFAVPAPALAQESGDGIFERILEWRREWNEEREREQDTQTEERENRGRGSDRPEERGGEEDSETPTATSTPATSTPPAAPRTPTPPPTTPLSNGASIFAGGISALGLQSGTPYGGVYAPTTISQTQAQLLLTLALAMGAFGFLLADGRSLRRLLGAHSALTPARHSA